MRLYAGKREMAPKSGVVDSVFATSYFVTHQGCGNGNRAKNAHSSVTGETENEEKQHAGI